MEWVFFFKQCLYARNKKNVLKQGFSTESLNMLRI